MPIAVFSKQYNSIYINSAQQIQDCKTVITKEHLLGVQVLSLMPVNIVHD